MGASAIRIYNALVCAVLISGSWGGLVWANSSQQYTFDSAEDYLTQASQFSSWAQTLSTHAAERDAVLSCNQPGKHCRGRLRSFNRMLEKARALSRLEQIDLVNLYINRTKYDDDYPARLYDENGKKIGVQRNRWATLREFLTAKGDCEDYATAKYFMLRELGFTPDEMRVVVTWERKLRGYHAVLALRQPDGAVWLLDSDNRIRKRSHRGYRFVYAMNEVSVWDHRDDFQPNISVGANQ